MKKLISVDLVAKFGFFKKNDTNEGIYFTYNCIHKPAVIGILGAVIGLKGYFDFSSLNDKLNIRELPEYWKKLSSIPVGIKILNSSNCNFKKVIIDYTNTVGYANNDGILPVKEQTLVNPSYRVYILLDDQINEEMEIYNNLKGNKAEFIPYMGKNEFQLWWSNFTQYDDYEKVSAPNSEFCIDTIFTKDIIVRDNKIEERTIFQKPDKSNFIYFEHLPVGFDPELGNYSMGSFAYTNFRLSRNVSLRNLYKTNNTLIMQLN